MAPDPGVPQQVSSIYSSKPALCSFWGCLYPWLSSATIKRYSQQYGTRVRQLLEQVTTEQDMGIQFASGVYQTEIDFLITQEFAVTAQDILWRRTKLGLSLSASSQQAICDYIKQRQSQLKSA